MRQVDYYLLFDRIEVQAANALSSPITYGFPAITGFVGAVHALSRNIPADQEISLDGVLIASHDCQVQMFRPYAYADYRFNQSRNPIKKTGKTASIIEEGKVNLTVSLLVEVKVSDQSFRQLRDNPENFTDAIKKRMLQQRIAGGSVQNIRQVRLFTRSDAKDITTALLPAFVLMDARNELIAITQELQQKNPQATVLDALVDVVTLHRVPETDDKGNTNWTTQSVKTGRGWLVPMPVGFQAICEPFKPGELENCRNPEYPSHYTECIYSLGKWLFPHRLKEELSSGFWRYDNTHPNLYLMTQTIPNL